MIGICCPVASVGWSLFRFCPITDGADRVATRITREDTDKKHQGVDLSQKQLNERSASARKRHATQGRAARPVN
jgi:hypothetical protein